MAESGHAGRAVPDGGAAPEGPATPPPARVASPAAVRRWLGLGLRDFAAMPMASLFYGSMFVAMAFVLFRILDILKPPPCRALQGVKGGRGILLDDVFAGIYACVVMHVASPVA